VAQLDYICTKQEVQDETGEPRTAYCFQVLDSNGAVLLAVDDVCGSEERARALEALFRRNQVAPVHVMDVLEDFLS